MRRKAALLSLLTLATGTPVVSAPVRGLTRIGVLPERVWSRLPVRRTFRVALPDGAGFTYASTTGDFIGRRVFWRGLDGYEGETTRVFYQLARQARVVLDVGAHTGFFTLLACAANPNARVVAFEPVPRIFDRLNEQIARNGWQARCQTHRTAVADRTGTITLHVPGGDLPYSASLDPDGFYGVPGELVETPVQTIDDACAGIEAIDLVKIDVEGFEDKVLAGMRQILATAAPAIIFEVVPGRDVSAVESLLAGFGYRFYHLREHGPAPVDTIGRDSTARNRNYLAVASERIDLGGADLHGGPSPPTTSDANILRVVHYPIYGGPHNEAVRLEPVFRACGMRSLMLLPDEPGNARARIETAGVEVVAMPLHRLRAQPDPRLQLDFLIGFVPAVRRIARLIRERNVDLVLIGGLANPHAAIAARLAGVPVVWQIVDSRTSKALLALTMPFVRRLADAVMFDGAALI
ncbi:MAG: FkbM family methyltransferase, partial [Thermomicrobiales bacterium]